MKLKVLGVVLLQAVLVILNVLFFMWTGPERSNVVWLSYAFSTIAYLILEAVIIVPRKYKWRTWNLSLVYIAAMLFVSELVLGIILACVTTSVAFCVTVQLILLLGFMIWGYMHVTASMATTSALNKQEREAVYAKDLALQVKDLIVLVPDASARKYVKELYESIWCSPRASNKQAMAYEARIAAGIEELKVLIADTNWEEVEKLAKELIVVVKQRNTILK